MAHPTALFTLAPVSRKPYQLTESWSCRHLGSAADTAYYMRVAV